MGLVIFSVIFGNFQEKSIPKISGRPKTIKTEINIWYVSMVIGFSSSVPTELVYLIYNPPQKAKLSGVINTAKTVATAVRLTDNSTFPFANEEMKFEILPPGQAATRIIPIATD